MSKQQAAATIAHIQRMGYAVSRIEWKGWVEYTAWGRSAGAAVLTAAAQAYNEAQAVSQLSRRITEQRGAV